MSFRLIINRFLTGFAISSRLILIVIPIGIIWLLFLKKADTSSLPHYQFEVKDVSKQQQFVVPGRSRLHAISLVYEIEGVVDDSAVVRFRAHHYDQEDIHIIGPVKLHYTRDAYEADDIIIDYIPMKAKKGEITLRLSVI